MMYFFSLKAKVLDMVENQNKGSINTATQSQSITRNNHKKDLHVTIIIGKLN